jgi:AraC-like DNA-binding protein
MKEYIFNTLEQYQKGQELNKEEITFRYGAEEKIMNAISSGNSDHLQEVIHHIQDQNKYDTVVRRIPENYLRDRKNGMVIRNTFCRIAAKNGGLPPILLHLISEKYALEIENATSASYFDNALSESMLKEYCSSVQNFSTSNYSEMIKNIAIYISNHLTEEILLNEVASFFHINAAHLSRKFKKETGFTFIDYINRHRVEYAKLLFHEGYTSITDVAGRAGFNSSSYFSKVFKNIAGVSPSSYLEEKNNGLN